MFTKISDIRLGVMYGESGTYLLVTGSVKSPLTSDEKTTLKNFLTAESGLTEIELDITSPSSDKK